MPQKMGLWHSGLALAMPGSAMITTGLVNNFRVAKTTYMPNFNPLDPPHGSEEGPVVLWAGPGHLQPGEGHPQPSHCLSYSQHHLHTQFQPSGDFSRDRHTIS